MTYETAYGAFLDFSLEIHTTCEKLYVAGSVRRLKDEVKDIEVVALPFSDMAGLFSDSPVRSNEFCHILSSRFVIAKGDVKTGRYLKIAYSLGINIDLFLPEKDDFYRIYAIRTGSADFAKNVLAVGWRKLGWVGTKDGLRRESECDCSIHTEFGISVQKQIWTCKVKNPTLPPVWKSEIEFFDWLGVKYVEPKNRI